MFEWFKDKAKWAYYGAKEKIESIFGAGAGEQAKLKYFKTVLTNMASKIIGMLHDSLNEETQKNGKQAIANEKKAAKKAEKGTVSPNKAKASIKDASINVKAPGMAAGKAAGIEPPTPEPWVGTHFIR